MLPSKNVDLDPEEQAALREWRELVVEHYTEDIEHLEGMEESVHGFHIEHRLIDEKPTLRRIFHERPTRALELGFRIMREQFDAHKIPTRPVLRVVGLSDNYLNSVDELRMRDRNQLVALDVKINDISQPYGWLKQAVYECLDCGATASVKQRRARQRESPRTCRTCLQKAFEGIKTDNIPIGLFNPLPHFTLRQEDCVYEDAVDLSMSQITYNQDYNLINCSTHNQIIGTVSDDLIDQMVVKSYVRVNAIVRVEPIPDRTFAKDTRRLLALDILSVEELPIRS